MKKTLLFLAVGILGIPYMWWAWAVAFVRIWNWYRADWMPLMTFKVALGVSFVSAMFYRIEDKKKEERDPDDDTPWGRMIGMLVFPWLVLVCARVALWMFFE